jgi:hypothetical protein
MVVGQQDFITIHMALACCSVQFWKGGAAQPCSQNQAVDLEQMALSSLRNPVLQCCPTCQQRYQSWMSVWLAHSLTHTSMADRTPEEFQAGRPKNAVNIPIMFRTAEGEVKRTQPCRSKGS